MSDERLIDQNVQAEDVDAAMRPKTLDSFIGQKKGAKISPSLSKRRRNVATRLIMFYWRVRLVSAKPHWRKLWHVNWGRGFAPPPVR